MAACAGDASAEAVDAAGAGVEICRPPEVAGESLDDARRARAASRSCLRLAAISSIVGRSSFSSSVSGRRIPTAEQAEASVIVELAAHGGYKSYTLRAFGKGVAGVVPVYSSNGNTPSCRRALPAS